MPVYTANIHAFNEVSKNSRSVDKTQKIHFQINALSKWKPLVIQHQFITDFVYVNFKRFWFIESWTKLKNFFLSKCILRIVVRAGRINILLKIKETMLLLPIHYAKVFQNYGKHFGPEMYFFESVFYQLVVAFCANFSIL